MCLAGDLCRDKHADWSESIGTVCRIVFVQLGGPCLLILSPKIQLGYFYLNIRFGGVLLDFHTLHTNQLTLLSWTMHSINMNQLTHTLIAPYCMTSEYQIKIVYLHNVLIIISFSPFN